MMIHSWFCLVAEQLHIFGSQADPWKSADKHPGVEKPECRLGQTLPEETELQPDDNEWGLDRTSSPYCYHESTDTASAVATAECQSHYTGRSSFAWQTAFILFSIAATGPSDDKWAIATDEDQLPR
jgi:hypothetical protein